MRNVRQSDKLWSNRRFTDGLGEPREMIMNSLIQPELRRNLPAIALVIYIVVGFATIVVWSVVSILDARRADTETVQADVRPLSAISSTKFSPTRVATSAPALINDGLAEAKELPQRGEASPPPAPQPTSTATTAFRPANDGSAEVKEPPPQAVASPPSAPQPTSIATTAFRPANDGSAEVKEPPPQAVASPPPAPQPTSTATTAFRPANDGSAEAKEPPPLAMASPLPAPQPTSTAT